MRWRAGAFRLMDRSGIREVQSGEAGSALRLWIGWVKGKEREVNSCFHPSLANDFAAWAGPVGFACFGILSFFCGESKT